MRVDSDSGLLCPLSLGRGLWLTAQRENAAGHYARLGRKLLGFGWHSERLWVWLDGDPIPASDLDGVVTAHDGRATLTLRRSGYIIDDISYRMRPPCGAPEGGRAGEREDFGSWLATSLSCGGRDRPRTVRPAKPLRDLRVPR